MSPQLTVRNAQVSTASVQIKTLTISGKQVTLAVFRQIAEHVPHTVMDLPSLDDEPRCEIRWECPEHGGRQCPEPAEWALIQPCSRCGAPVSTLLCTGCKDTLIRRGDISAASVRKL